MLSTAALLGLAMKCAVTVHPDTTLDVIKAESSGRPLAIAVVNEKSIYPNTLEQALSAIKRLKARRANYSVGLAQINQSNFSKYGVTALQLFDPCTNLTVYEKIITDCYIRGKTLKRALSCYYSGNFNTGQKPESAFSQTSYVERIGYPRETTTNYVVPSTRTDKAQETLPPKAPLPGRPRVVWPKNVIRGELKQTPSSQDNPTVIYPSQVVRGKIAQNTTVKDSGNETD
ncbi:lytic transglycosylase domain-containing protein [Pantoea ananatis]|uniref:lytic transglycosylase domain-containing protein n=1 Tax=Pantoea ananas TaxID=553 RepID=UPI001B3063AB|nr:lytic transglycosylase domain-containing protein [Pantoea ananatis]